MNLSSGFNRLNGLLATIAGWLRSPLLLVIRLWWGWSFFVTGKAHLSQLARTTSFFASLHIPFPRANVILAGGTECVGGLLLLAGLFTRIISVPLMFTMLVAYITADNEALHAILSDTDKFTGATPFLFLYAAVIVFVFGPGRISLDALFFRNTAK